MANVLFSKGREGILDRTIDMTGDVRAMLVKSTYTFDDNDVFLSDLGVVDNGRSAALGTKTYALGVFNAANISLVATLAVVCNVIILFQHTGVDGTARLIVYIDGKMLIEIASDASSGATLIWVENIPGALANGAVMTKLSGTGPATIVLNETGEVDERHLTVNAIGADVVAGAIYEVALASNVFPFTPGVGQTVNFNWDTGANKIFKL